MRNAAFPFIVLAVIVLAVAGGVYELTRTFGKHHSVTFTVKDKHRDWIGSSKDETAWVVKTTSGDTYQVSNTPFTTALDALGRPKAYRRMHDGERWRCDARGRSIARAHKWARVRSCERLRS
jgi:hypothetical protein